MAHKTHYTYRTTCLTTGRFYVGMHSTTNPYDGYLGSGTQISRSIKKHGKTAHRLEVLEHFADRAALKTGEKALITEELLADPLCMNIAPGGGGGRLPGFTHSLSTRAKISIKNRSGDPVVRAKIAATLTGRTNEEHSRRQLNRFLDKANHPRTLHVILTEPSGEQHTLLGWEALDVFCKEKGISQGRLKKYRGLKVPGGKIQGGTPVSYATEGWRLS